MNPNGTGARPSVSQLPQNVAEMPPFSEWLTIQLESKGIGQREFARMVGVKPAAVRTWLTGFSIPGWHTCQGIADALGEPREFVRQLCGYVDDDEQPPIPDAGEDEITRDMLLHWRALPEEMKHHLLSMMRELVRPSRPRQPGR